MKASNTALPQPHQGGTTRHAVDGDHLLANVTGPLGIRDEFEITLRDGWCWIEGSRVSAAMAAVPLEDAMRFAWASQLKVPGGRFAAPLTRQALIRTLRDLETLVLQQRQSSHGKCSNCE